MKKYLITFVAILAFVLNSKAQKIDSLQLLKDVNGGDVVFTAIAANDVSWGNGYGTNNMAFITGLRNYTNSTLPISLSSFKPVKEATTLKLLWSTISEQNSDYFEVLRSTDGVNFTVLGLVSAAGNSKQKLEYVFKDTNPLNGINYYQLNMVDKDGSAKKSGIVSATFDINRPDFNVVKDVERDLINLSIYSSKLQDATLDVFEINGKLLLSKRIVLQMGNNNQAYKINTEAKIILVRLNVGGIKQTKKLFY